MSTAIPGKTYYNPTTKQVRRYSSDYLASAPGIGEVSSQFSEGSPDPSQAPNYRYYQDDKETAMDPSTVGGAAAPASSKPDPIADYYKNLRTTELSADEQTAAREKRLKEVQDQLDATNSYYQSLLAQTGAAEDAKSKESAARVRGLNVSAGLTGSPEASKAAQEDFNLSTDRKQKSLAVIQAEQARAVAAIRGAATKAADDDIKAQKLQAEGNQEKYLSYLEKTRTERQTTARTNLAALAKSQGRDKLSEEEWNKLIEDSGMDPLSAEAYYKANSPTPEYFSPIQTKDGSLIVVDKQGNMKNLGKYDLPDNAKFVFGPDGTPLIFDPTTKSLEIPSGYYKGQFAKGGGGGGNTTKQDARIIALGITDWAPDAQKVVLNGLSQAEQKKFVSDFKKHKTANPDADPLTYIDQWATEQGDGTIK